MRSHPLCWIACALFCIYFIKGWLQTNIHWLRLEPHDSLLAGVNLLNPQVVDAATNWSNENTTKQTCETRRLLCWCLWKTADMTKQKRAGSQQSKTLFTLVWLKSCVYLFQMRPNVSSRITTHQAQWKTSGTVADLFAGEVFTFFNTFFPQTYIMRGHRVLLITVQNAKVVKIKTYCCLKYDSGD